MWKEVSRPCILCLRKQKFTKSCVSAVKKWCNRFYAVTPWFTVDTHLFVDFYQVITAKDICFLCAIAFVVLYAFLRLLAVKAETSRVGHLSPSARGLTTVKTLLIFQDMCAPRIKMELFRCPKCHDMLLSNTCRSIFLIG